VLDAHQDRLDFLPTNIGVEVMQGDDGPVGVPASA
jgi:hypothetical protein